MITWEDYRLLTLDLCKKVSHIGKPDLLIGLSRGGAILACLMSHALDVDCHLINKPIEGYILPLELAEKKRIVIVDDIVDTGKTALDLLTVIPMSEIASLYYKKQSILRPTHYIEEVPNETWVHFPYELKVGRDR